MVIQHSEDHFVVSVAFGEGGAQSKDIQALRIVSTDWAQRPAAQALSQLKGKSEVVLGSFESSAARKLVEHCQSLQLSAAADPQRVTSLSLFNEITKTFALIEDEQLSVTLAKEAISHGIPVRHSTV
ncbi:hypothetical protein GRF61_12210 [Azoarcus sp. TTM-91]|uniref:hypothetical protein n=1 Tax=Azoarcus sp. TTM-91 TaxID=2691581 RepID=UPI00145E980C|nr:hypothetical protein [Azoarcus sp. TTM-91]NMG35208.1 hypothetical protein [Azoarcus sp. TTM-91]